MSFFYYHVTVMTLKFRNKITRAFFYFSSVCVVIAAAYLVAGIVSNSIHPVTSTRVPELLNSIPFMPYASAAAFIAAGFLFIYVPVVLFFIRRYFVNTQSSEIIFFYGFLLACLSEGIRLVIPLFDISNSVSSVFLFLCRILYAGRFLAPISFIFLSILSDSAQRHDIEKNFFLMIAVSGIIALIIPVNSAELTTTFEPTYGFSEIFNVFRFILFAVVIISLLFSARKRDIKELQYLSSDFAFLFSGYIILTISDNYVLLAAGAVLLPLGTARFLLNLHRIYM
ncbi:MAG: hypothetical protein J6Y93_03670 [Treponema sp.]|nr:hypothetical protein [Treponema sp.]